MVLVLQSITPRFTAIQSIPKTTSIPSLPNTTRYAWNRAPWISTGVSLQDKLAFVVAPGICTIIGRFKRVGIIPLFLTKGSVTKEWDAPESNNTNAGTELTGNVPITRSGSSWASSALMWFRCPLVMGMVFFWKGSLPPGGLVGP